MLNLGKRLAFATYSGTMRECRTNPCFLAVAIGLEEVKTFVSVVVVSVEAVH